MNYFQKEHLQIVRRLAIAIHNKSGYDLEDLYSEGCLQYLNKVQKFDAKKGAALKTFLSVSLFNLMLTYTNEQKKRKFISLSDIEKINLDSFGPLPSQITPKRMPKDAFTCGELRMY